MFQQTSAKPDPSTPTPPPEPSTAVPTQETEQEEDESICPESLVKQIHDEWTKEITRLQS